MAKKMMRLFYEFFAGGGMARAGLGDGWQCVFANDIDEKKALSYAQNWGNEHLSVKDVAAIEINEIPDEADLAWASFPCQDLSLAGSGGGLKAKRSGTFWSFWKLIRGLLKDGRAPKLIVLENVYGALTSHQGEDFAAIASALSGAEYRFGAVVIDAVHFLPQSRPRLFIIGVRKGIKVPKALCSEEPNPLWHPKAIFTGIEKISKTARARWIWWNIPSPKPRSNKFIDMVEDTPTGVHWRTVKETKYLVGLMSSLHKEKLKQVQKTEQRIVGTVYRRTRNGEQRAEVRFDDIAGCLRTPTGGSSRQTILLVKGKQIKSRLLSPREAARLMGLQDSYKLPVHYNTAYHLVGDGVAVPVVRYLTEHILEPIINCN